MTISDETQVRPSTDPRGVKESSTPAQAVALGLQNVVSDIYGAVYSGVPVFEMMCRNVAVMRRQADSYLNATQILKVAGIDKGRRTKILEKEIINGEHEKVQGGYGKYQGTWIPFERGIQLAVQFQVEHYLAPILNFVPPSPGKGEFMPSKEQILAAASSKDTPRANATGQGRRKSSVGDNRSPDVTRKQRKKSNVGLPSALSQEAHMNDQHLEHSLVEEPASKKARLGEGPDSVSDVVPHASLGERHRAPLMAMFLSDNPLSIPEILLQSQSPADLNVNIVIDDQGHTALHWAAALARIDILRLLLAKGGNVKVVNFHSESALIRSVLVTNNYDNQTFPDLLNLLAPSLSMLDADGRSVLHHIALVSGCRGRSPSSRYYMECTLEYIAKNGGNFSSLLDIMDVHGDTAINLAARVGAHFLVGQLLDVGANPHIENLAGLNPSNFGFGKADAANSAALSNSVPSNEPSIPQAQINPVDTDKAISSGSLATRVVFPSLPVNQDQASSREHQETLSENSQTHLTETQIQLKELTREIVELRQQNSALREQSRRIPELEERIRNLAQGLEHEISRRSHSHAVETGSSVSVEADHDGSLGSLLNEITHLKSLLAGKDKAEHDLKKEIVTLKSTTNSQEFKCKQIISACVGVPLESVESLLDPLLRALQTDDPIDTLDVSQVSRLMGKMKEQEARVIERAA